MHNFSIASALLQNVASPQTVSPIPIPEHRTVSPEPSPVAAPAEPEPTVDAELTPTSA